PTAGLSPYRELGRKIEGLAGEVPVRWRVEPRFGYASSATRIERRAGVPIATAGRDAIAVCSFGAGEATTSDAAIAGHFTARAGSSSLLVLSAAHQGPLVLPARARSRPVSPLRAVLGASGAIDATTTDLGRLGPPLNSAGNAAHAFYPTVRAARAEFRRRARTASPSGAR